MGVACVNLSFSFIKGIYVGHIQWDIMRKPPTTWANLYGYGVLVMNDTFFARVDRNFMETACLTQGPWFGNFMRWYKLCIWVIKKDYFGVTRRSFPHIHWRDSNSLVGEEDEERKIPCHGNFEGTVYERNWGEMAYSALSMYNKLRDQSKEMSIHGCGVVNYPLQWYVEVYTFGLVICLVNNNG